MGEVAVGSKGARLRRFLPARLRGEVAGAATSIDEPIAVAKPTAYRTFSRKLAPAMTGLGGLLALIGGLGTWLRATRVASEGLAAEEVEVVMGYELDSGRAIAALGAAAMLASLIWLMRRLFIKLVPIALSIAAVALIAWRVPRLESQAADLAADARAGELDFFSFHAGLGWGAWCLVPAAMLLALGVFAGVLRELDVRKGVGE